MTPTDTSEPRTEACPECGTLCYVERHKLHVHCTPVDGRKQPAHRFSYRMHKGPIPDGYEVDHLCFNTGCVNPDHLEAVTPQVNSMRSAARITHCPQGHPYAGANLAFVGNSRRCKACAYPRVREWKRRRRAAA